MTRRTQALLARALEALEAARYNLDGGFERQAALLTLGEAPKTHAGILRRLLVHFVQTERLPEAHTRALPRAYQLRQEASYDDGATLEAETPEELLHEVMGFVTALREVLDELP